MPRLLRDRKEPNRRVIIAFDCDAQACSRHGTAPTASAALGRGLVGALLLSAFREENEKTQVGK